MNSRRFRLDRGAGFGAWHVTNLLRMVMPPSACGAYVRSELRLSRRLALHKASCRPYRADPQPPPDRRAGICTASAHVHIAAHRWGLPASNQSWQRIEQKRPLSTFCQRSHPVWRCSNSLEQCLHFVKFAWRRCVGNSANRGDDTVD